MKLKQLSFLFLAFALLSTSCQKANTVTSDSASDSGQITTSESGTESNSESSSDSDSESSSSSQHEHDYSEESLETPPTETEEGLMRLTCACGESITKKILKLPSIHQDGCDIVWSEVNNAFGYYFFSNGNKIDVGSLTSYTLKANELENAEFSVVAYPDEGNEYVYYENVKSSISLRKSNINVQLGHNHDFEIDESSFVVEKGVVWGQYPYGNWSDSDYYIERDDTTNNTYVKIPATVWYPQSVRLQKDLGVATAKAGKYQVSFDLKLSQKANDCRNSAGEYGHMAVALWTGLETVFTINEQKSNIKVANTETWTRVSYDYTLDKDYGNFMHLMVTYWPEVDLNNNYILIDNIEFHKYDGDVLGSENIDTIAGGDFEKWNYNKLPVDTWCANNSICVEPTAEGSEIVNDDFGRALKITGSGPVAKFNISGNTEVLGSKGIFEINLKMKKGQTLTSPKLTMAMWSWAGSSSAFNLVDELSFNLAEVNDQSFTTISAKFISKGMANCTAINIFFCLYFNNVENPEDKYAIFDELEIFRIDDNEEESTNILFIGNSFGIDTIEYLYPILENVGMASNVNIYEVYIGGSSIDQHYDNYIHEAKAYELVKYENGTWKYYGNHSIQDVLTLHSKWDVINFQQSTSLAVDSSTFSNFESLTTLIRKAVGGETIFSFLLSWAYSAQHSKVISDFDSDPNKMYLALVNTYQTLFGGETNPYQIKTLVPTCTAVENARPFYGQSLYRDELHLDLGLGRFIAGLTWATTIFGLDPETVTFKASNMSDSDLQIIIQCVKRAIEKPFEQSNITIA